MNTKNNRRRRASMERIEQAFLSLLQTRELHQIRVGELCQLAGVNRSTFYANYADLYALADTIRTRLEDQVAALYEEEVTQGFHSHNYLKLFRHIAENPLFYQTYFKLGYDEQQYNLWRYDTALAEKYFENRFVDYHLAFFKSGLTKIIKLWLQNGCRETPEEMFEIVQSEYRGRDEFFDAGR